MTDEAHGQSHDDTPTPPASTRWSEDPVQDDESLAPPFVPGRSAGPTAGATAEDRAPAPTTPAEPAPAPAEDEDEDALFPFETSFGADEEPETVPEDDFPFDQFDIDGGAAPSTEEETGSGWSPSTDVEWEPEPTGEPLEPVEETSEPAEIPEAELVPLDAVSEPVVDVEVETTAEQEDVYEAEPVGPAADSGAEEVAGLLDRLAGLLREEGAEAVRREMESSDRLTALLSGLIAGYLSGRS